MAAVSWFRERYVRGGSRRERRRAGKGTSGTKPFLVGGEANGGGDEEDSLVRSPRGTRACRGVLKVEVAGGFEAEEDRTGGGVAGSGNEQRLDAAELPRDLCR